MNRIAIMTAGFLLVFVGIQMKLVESYVLKPEASRYWANRWTAAQIELQNNFGSANSSPYYQTGYSPNGYSAANSPTSRLSKVITPPRWICWPVFFMGAVLFLHGIAMARE